MTQVGIVERRLIIVRPIGTSLTIIVILTALRIFYEQTDVETYLDAILVMLSDYRYQEVRWLPNDAQ
jgi:hypothetical protein